MAASDYYDPYLDSQLPPPANMNPGVDPYDPGLQDTQVILNQPQNPQQMGAYDPSYPYGTTGSGSGVPTQNAVARIVGGISNFFIPGLGFVTSPMAKMLMRAYQNHGANQPPGDKMSSWRQFLQRFSGGKGDAHKMGMYDPNFAYGNPNYGYVPQLTGDSYFNANQGPFKGGAFWSPPGGSIGGPLGTGSHGEIGWNYFGDQGMRRLLHGGDPSLGFEGFQPNLAGAPVLPMDQWGGAGVMGGPGNTQSTTERRMSQV